MMSYHLLFQNYVINNRNLTRCIGDDFTALTSGTFLVELSTNSNDLELRAGASVLDALLIYLVCICRIREGNNLKAEEILGVTFIDRLIANDCSSPV